MNTCINKHRILGSSAAAAALAALLPLAGLAGEPIDQTLEMSPGGKVFVENLAGSIEFSTWDRAEVQIHGEAGDSVEAVEASATSGGVQVRVRNRQSERHIDETELFLKIPHAASIEAESVSADISVDGSRGESLILETVSGDLEVKALSQRAELSSVSGDIEFEGQSMRTAAESVSGDVTLVGVSGEVSASTVSGDISLDADAVSRARFESVSGEMILSLSVAADGRLQCDSMSGDITLALPGSQQAGFIAQSYSGSIRTDFGKASGVGHEPGVVLRHQEGDSGTEIRLESFSGDISIRKR